MSSNLSDTVRLARNRALDNVSNFIWTTSVQHRNGVETVIHNAHMTYLWMTRNMIQSHTRWITVKDNAVDPTSNYVDIVRCGRPCGSTITNKVLQETKKVKATNDITVFVKGATDKAKDGWLKRNGYKETHDAVIKIIAISAVNFSIPAKLVQARIFHKNMFINPKNTQYSPMYKVKLVILKTFLK